jgi:hypothetical protein
MQRLEETLKELMQNAPSMPGQENNAPSLPLKNNEGLDNTELPTSQTELAD